MKNSNKLEGKDLVNIGIYCAIFFIIVMVVSFLGFIPVMIPLLTVFCPLAGGIPFMLFLTKVKKFGMIFIFSVIIGTLLMVTGMGIYPFITSFITGIAADLIYRAGKYSSKKASVLCYGVICITEWANELPIFINIDKYFSTRTSFGEEYVQTLTACMPQWLNPILLVASFVFGCLGALVGIAVLKKHFSKAGII